MVKLAMIVLAIESTFDETGACVAKTSGSGVEILSNVLASSSEMHKKYGGVVPEVAAREQIKVILTVIKEALEKAGISHEDLDSVAVTHGPGLIGSLLVGVETLKTLSLVWNKPLIPVNHMVGHVLANWIVDDKKKAVPEMPAVALVVSGGHTDLILMKTIKDWVWLGGTRDDASGECFDKVARILGLGYPGGPVIEQAAEEVQDEKQIFKLPRPLIYEKTYDMSFSGLKSAVSRIVDDFPEDVDMKTKKLLARELSEAVVEVLVNKTVKAVDEFAPKSVLLAGGVAASKKLREKLAVGCEKYGVELFMPEFKYCTDNGAMIAAAALLRPEEVDVLDLKPIPGLETV